MIYIQLTTKKKGKMKKTDIQMKTDRIPEVNNQFNPDIRPIPGFRGELFLWQFKFAVRGGLTFLAHTIYAASIQDQSENIEKLEVLPYNDDSDDSIIHLHLLTQKKRFPLHFLDSRVTS